MSYYKYGYEDGRRGVEAKISVNDGLMKIKIYGSDHGYDWLVNFRAWPRRYGFHKGWYNEAEKLYDFIDENVEDHIEKIEIIGQSAGGAIGAILMFMFYLPVTVITVNSPSHGKAYRMSENITALVHRGDIVRHFPIFYAKPKIKKYGRFTWFWKAHNEMPEVWREW